MLKTSSPPPQDLEHEPQEPAQSTGQACSLQAREVGQASPPLAGCVVTVKVCEPPPQVLEHEPHVPAQSTTTSGGSVVGQACSLQLRGEIGQATPLPDCVAVALKY